MEEEQTAAASHDASKKKEKEGEDRHHQQQQQHARNQAELGLLNPSGRTTADPLGARRHGGAKRECINYRGSWIRMTRAGLTLYIATTAGDVPAAGMTARSLGAASQAHSVMAENMQVRRIEWVSSDG